MLEASTRQCPHCEGTGLVRTASSAGLGALRMLEEEAARGRGSVITLRASQEAAFYVLNNKRSELDEIEQRYGVRIVVLPDGEIEGARMSVEPSGPRPERVVTYAPLAEEEDDLDVIEDEEEEEEIEEEAAPERQERGERGDRRRSRMATAPKGRHIASPRAVCGNICNVNSGWRTIAMMSASAVSTEKMIHSAKNNRAGLADGTDWLEGNWFMSVR